MRGRGWTGFGRPVYADALFRGVRVTVRPPRLSDAAAWSRTRIADEERLRPAFADRTDEDWRTAQSELAFVERCLRLRLAAARGLAYPAIIVGPGDGTPVVYGEAGLDAVDPRTSTGELSAWSALSAPAARVARWASGAVILAAFTAPKPLRRVTAPFAVANRGEHAGLVALGFDDEGLLRQYRWRGGSWADHHLFVVHNTPRVRADLQRFLLDTPG